ncbi:hypothetical protein D0Z03_002670 [Geotrichum reessii]|nr:hypothetical protein D0Z03_002670 [Galactomyces reessii]
MKFSSAGLLAITASIVAAAPEVGKVFGLITIRSGSPVQNAGLSVAADNTVEINSSNKDWVTGTFQEDGTISLGEGKFLGVSDNNLVTTSEGAIFSADDSDHLSYEGSTGFTAVSNNGIYKIKTSKVSAGPDDYNVALRIFYTGAIASQTSSASGASSAIAPVATAQNSTISQVNGASQNSAVFGAALVGVAGALLI